MNTYSFRTIIEPNEDGTYSAFVPALPGCQTWGWKTIEETRGKLREAITLYLQTLVADGDPIPQEHGFESIEMVTMSMARA